MNFRFTVVEIALNRAEFRWKWLRFVRLSLVLGVVLCGIGLLLGTLIVKGWLTDRSLASTIIAVSCILGLLSWIALAIVAFSRSPDRDQLGAAMERVDRRLLDRLNTLLFLEHRRSDPRAESFARSIAKQTQRVIAQQPLVMPFSARRPFRWLIVLAFALLANLIFYRVYSPFSHLVASPRKAKPMQLPPALASQLELPMTNNVERSGQWGEVRITDPGRDLKVTRLAVVPLQIEAAANQPIREVSWYHAINGGEPVLHSLPPPKEPKYSVYQPSLELANLPLTNWDVVSYYARATTEKSNVYSSGVYFIEVRPFREELLGMPGGEDGDAYKFLKALSGLIANQEEAIRQTHQARSSPAQQAERKKLAGMESDLADAARSLHAEMEAAQPGNESLEDLEKAGKSLDTAGKTLDSTAPVPDAEKQELTALNELTAARREFQRSISDQKDKGSETTDDAAITNQLGQISEFRNESSAGQDFVKRALEAQKAMEREVQSKPASQYPQLASRENDLAQGLKDFQQQHPQAFQQSQEESKQAGQAMSEAAESLRNQRPDSTTATREATQKLDQLSQAMKEHAVSRQLADAYKLKQLLDQQAQTFGECANPTAGDSGSRLQKAAGETKETLNQLRRMAEQEPTRDAFGDPLRRALGGQDKVDLDAALSRLQQMQQDQAAQKKDAGAAREGLGKISQAFDDSEPGPLRTARQKDSLQPSPGDRLSRGMADLNNLIKQLEKGAPLSNEDRSQQGREALYGIQDGLRQQYGGNERGNQITVEVNQMLKKKELEVGDLKNLMQQLQMFAAENFEPTQQEEKPEVTNIDPARMPPAYRGRIQKYFQKLSEQR